MVADRRQHRDPVIRAEFTPNGATTVAFTVRGVPIIYDAKKQELSVAGHRAPAPLRDG